MRHARLRSSALGLVFTVGSAPVPAVWAGEAIASDVSASLVQVRFRSEARGELTRRAALGAARRLAEPACRAVLGDFADEQGVRLDARLAKAGLSVEDWMRGVYFYDGQDQGTCQRRGVLAVTGVGSRVVYVCPAFVRERGRDPGLTEALIIHELLHTLGLAENPPTSLEINRRVFERCGR